MAELDSDFGGKVRLPLPPVFSGEPSQWEDWEWNFKIYRSLFQSEAVDFLDRAAASDVPVIDTHFNETVDADVRAALLKFCRKLHYLLANLTKDSARLLVRQNVGQNGFETWRRLHSKFSMPDAQREHSLLAQVLDWKFNVNTFEQDFNAWETVKARYEALAVLRFRTVF